MNRMTIEQCQIGGLVDLQRDRYKPNRKRYRTATLAVKCATGITGKYDQKRQTPYLQRCWDKTKFHEDRAADGGVREASHNRIPACSYWPAL